MRIKIWTIVLLAVPTLLALALATKHWGFAIRISSYLFVFLLALVIWRLLKSE